MLKNIHGEKWLKKVEENWPELKGITGFKVLKEDRPSSLLEQIKNYFCFKHKLCFLLNIFYSILLYPLSIFRIIVDLNQGP